MIQFTSFYQSLSGAYDPYLAAVYPTHKVSMKPLEPIETSSLLALYSFRLHWFFLPSDALSGTHDRCVCDAQMPFAHLTDLNRPGNMWHMISRSAVLEDHLSFSSLPDLFVLHGWSPSLGIWGSGTELQTWFLFVSPFSTWGSFEV